SAARRPGRLRCLRSSCPQLSFRRERFGRTPGTTALSHRLFPHELGPSCAPAHGARCGPTMRRLNTGWPTLGAMTRTTLSAQEARRAALAAQGFGRPRDGATARSLAAAIARMGVLQIDSVNVFARSHYMPLFSRLGGYDPADLDRLVMRRPTRSKPARYVEYIPH